MKTLYVSDLDGTLLKSDETLSAYTIDTLSELIESGMLFSYATARSLVTANKVTQGLNTELPAIVYNGAFVMDSATGEILVANYLDDSVREMLSQLFSCGVCPIVYAYIDGVEKFSFIPDKCTEKMLEFIQSRKGDKRLNPVDSFNELAQGDLFYVSCIDDPERLEPLYQLFQGHFHAVYQRDIYTKSYWLEIMAPNASKAQAILQLQEKLGCDKLVTFGDGRNDIDMFKISDEAYAVANADQELKRMATSVIAVNNDDAVAKWLEAHVDMAGNLA